jgi:hypothetical protein
MDGILNKMGVVLVAVVDHVVLVLHFAVLYYQLW